MGFWSSVKKIAKKAWRATKAVARAIVRVVAEAIGRVLGVVDLLIGFVGWPRKKLRLHIVVLSQASPIVTKDDPAVMHMHSSPIINPADLDDSINFAKQTLKEKFNVNLVSYSTEFVNIDDTIAPDYALNVKCNSGALSEEFSAEGEYFASKIAGWNAIPISLTFPITVFIVANVKDKQGCSLGPLTDYITLDPDGVGSRTTLMHEIGHSCGLWHSGTQSNIMYKNAGRGNGAKWFQSNLLRSSRHVLYW